MSHTLHNAPAPSMLRHFFRMSVATGALLAIAACADDPAAPFAVDGSGSISGRVFFDADNNGRFTPLGGDTALTGMTVQLRERQTTALIATTTTDAEGTFSFDDVPAGTHDVFLVNPNATLIFCVNPARASVYLGEQAFLSLGAKRGCVVRINVAEAQAQGTPATIAGVVTVRQGTYRNDNTYIQDNTGGIQIFGIPGALGLQEGDSIEVSGTLGLFGTEIQIVSPVVAPNIKRVATLSPKAITTGAMGALTPLSADVGRLAKVSRVSVGAFVPLNPSPPVAANAPINDGSGPSQLRLDGFVAGVIPQSTFAAGKCYDITGVIGIFSNVAQLKPRKLADVVEVPCAL